MHSAGEDGQPKASTALLRYTTLPSPLFGVGLTTTAEHAPKRLLLTEAAQIVGVATEQIVAEIKLGGRLLSLEES